MAILKGNAGKPLSKGQEVSSKEEVLALRAMANNLYVKDEIYEYIVNLVEATRTMEIFSMGASPRGTIALLRMAKAGKYNGYLEGYSAASSKFDSNNSTTSETTTASESESTSAGEEESK